MVKFQFRHKHLRRKEENKQIQKKLFDYKNKRLNILANKDLTSYQLQMVQFYDRKIQNIELLL
jgi:hypothetical protein